MSTYSIILLASGFFPFILSFYPPLKFYKNTKALFMALIITTIIFGLWDIIATARAHWYFEKTHITGLHIFNLPFEEVLFFIVIPFCSIFTWEIVKFIKRKLL